MPKQYVLSNTITLLMEYFTNFISANTQNIHALAAIL